MRSRQKLRKRKTEVESERALPIKSGNPLSEFAHVCHPLYRPRQSIFGSGRECMRTIDPFKGFCGKGAQETEHEPPLHLGYLRSEARVFTPNPVVLRLPLEFSYLKFWLRGKKRTVSKSLNQLESKPCKSEVGRLDKTQCSCVISCSQESQCAAQPSGH